MSLLDEIDRRAFLQAAARCATVAGFGAAAGSSPAAETASPGSDKKIKKSLKFNMVTGPGSVLEKFKMLKEVGFDGVELDSPTALDKKEILQARDATGLVINGTVDAVHWKEPLSSPSDDVRAGALAALKTALRETKEFGGSSVLLVPAVVNKQISYDDAYTRSQAEIREALPVAEETGVKIALENVWNNFLVSPLETARYIDEFNSPLVVSHFDVGNVLRYGWPEQWIRILGKRIYKLDIKEYSLKKMHDEGVYKGFNVELLEGDCDWPAVMRGSTKSATPVGARPKCPAATASAWPTSRSEWTGFLRVEGDWKSCQHRRQAERSADIPALSALGTQRRVGQFPECANLRRLALRNIIGDTSGQLHRCRCGRGNDNLSSHCAHHRQGRSELILEARVRSQKQAVIKPQCAPFSVRILDRSSDFEGLTFALHPLWHRDGHSGNAKRGRLALDFDDDRIDLFTGHKKSTRGSYAICPRQGWSVWFWKYVSR